MNRMRTMTSYRTLIAEAVSRYPLATAPDWTAYAADGVEVERIEADCASITTVDCLFDGHATVVLSDRREIPCQVFGRFDGRRVSVDRIVPGA
jgi:hypothetical protein